MISNTIRSLRPTNLREIEQFEEAHSLLAGLLETDLRCLDAHAHLGSMCFDQEVHRALQHFRVGCAHRSVER